MTTETTEYEKRVLAATPEKAVTFLKTTATKVDIRALLFAAGYSQEEQQVGWKLVGRATGHVRGVSSVDDDLAARAAIAEIDAFDEPGFQRVGAALERLHPEQNEFVFAGLSAARGAGSLLSVTTLLDRLDALESSDDRKATRKADQAAIATLTKRGITPELRAHLRQLLETAQSAVPAEFPENPSAEDRDAALKELRAWYKDWSQTARAVITRKDYLIMLGLSKRRRSNQSTPNAESEVDEVADDEVTDSRETTPTAAQ